MPARPFGLFASREANPIGRIKTFRDARRHAPDAPLFASGIEAMIGADAEHISPSCPLQGHFDLADAVSTVRSNSIGRSSGGNRPFDHHPRQSRLRRKASVGRHMRRFHSSGPMRPRLRQGQRTIHEGMAVARAMTGKDANPAMGGLACRPRVLPSDIAGCLALLQKAGLTQNQYSALIR